MGRSGGSSPPKLAENYWDEMATNWDEEIFNTLRNDRKRVIRTEIQKAARGRNSAADFGCGIGIYLPLLGKLFKTVHGFEQSMACVELARKRTRSCPNVTVSTARSSPAKHRGEFEVVLCVNVAIHPHRNSWLGALRSARNLLSQRGRLISVVPSIESAALLEEGERTDPTSPAPTIETARDASSRHRGVVWIEDVPIKHYSRRELTEVFPSLGMKIRRLGRVEYTWRCHGINPGRELRPRSPWDWLVISEPGEA